MKTLHQFLEQGEPAQEPKKEDSITKRTSVAKKEMGNSQLKQQQKKENMLKKRVLMTKMRAVRQGAAGIMASYEPDGELVEGVMKMIKSVTRKKKEKTAEKAMDAGSRAKRKLARKVHAKYVSGSEDNVPDDIREAKVDAGKSPEQKEKDRNVRKFGVSHNVAGHGKLRRALHRSDRGDKKIKGDKSAYVEMEAKKNPNNLVEPRDGVDSAKEVNRATRKAAFRPFNKESVVDEGVYERRKTKEVIAALKRDKRNLPYTTKASIARRIVSDKGDTSKSDDRYAYESVVKEGKKKGLWDNIHAKRKRGEKPAKPGDKDYPKTLNVEGLKQARKNVGADKCWDGYKAKGTKKKGGKEVPNCVKEDGVNEGAAWTKKSGKNPEGGLNEKGRKSYERDNPGSDLKAPQPEGGSRKKSFCARMGGMKKKLTSAKTANDPDSRINKALRKWNCSYEPQGTSIMEKETALDVVRRQIEKKHGKGAIYDPKKKQSSADKEKVAAERKKRQDADNKAYAARAKKAGYKSTQDYTNVVARYGSEDNYRKGKGLGT